MSIEIFPKLGRNTLRKILPCSRRRILDELDRKGWPLDSHLSNLLARIDAALFGMHGGKKKNQNT